MQGLPCTVSCLRGEHLQRVPYDMPRVREDPVPRLPRGRKVSVS